MQVLSIVIMAEVVYHDGTAKIFDTPYSTFMMRSTVVQDLFRLNKSCTIVDLNYLIMLSGISKSVQQTI